METISDTLVLLWDIFQAWGWILLPIFFIILSFKAWMWWRREIWEKKERYVLLEIIPPSEIEKPFKSMDQVFSNIWSIYSSLNWRKFVNKYIGGRKMYYVTCEVSSKGNEPHMYIRCREVHKDTIEAALYSQFPDAEIREVRDYVENIPFNVPNKGWNMYGFDEKLMKPDPYPIKTYSTFFEERQDTASEEKRIDPIGVLFEGLDRLKPEEQIWLQIRIQPITAKDSNYLRLGKQLVDKLTYRKKGTKAEKKQKEGSFIPPEMKLTAREREIVQAIENKLGKQAFKVNIRCLYFGKRDIFQRGRRTLAEQYFSGFNTQDLNSMKKWRRTKTRIYHFFTRRRLFIRQRRMFRRFLLREVVLYPKKEGNFVLNTEELATMFHFPVSARSLGTLLPRVHSKKSEGPEDILTRNR